MSSHKNTDILDDIRHICEDCGQITYVPPNDPKCPKCRHLEQRLELLEEITLNG